MSFNEENLKVAELEHELMVKGLKLKLLDMIKDDEESKSEQFEIIKKALANAEMRVSFYREQVKKEKENERI